ncbi:MAG: uroporphyrinogen-III C-methyltransferase [Methanomassiliicoccales archaeon]|nr:uroporphyrinogen-III C-methyltransferase [Methanomassiliicoccales archaeon]NYT15577.1 uroporphyrinogen-III C-methyltransferase [Methanomassiliicoccales archaeon]
MRSGETKGRVFLVGAGPGAPDLITIRGKELISRADVIVHDSLIPMELLSLARDEAEIIDVGKTGGHHKADQEEINNILVRKAKLGNLVVRLKGGDPFLFGRGGEEAEMLIREGIRVHLVPGVTSAISVPGLAGIPVTHRDHSSTVTFVTGHEGIHKGKETVNWSSLADLGGTIVILMGMSNLRSNMDNLINGGMDSSTTVAVIEKGSTTDQRVIMGTLVSIAELCEKEDVHAPSIIVVGGVATMREWLGDLE